MTKGQSEQVTDAQTSQSTELDNEKLVELLRNWAEEVGIDEQQKKDRQEARIEFLEAKLTNSKKIDLRNLSLTHIPDELLGASKTPCQILI